MAHTTRSRSRSPKRTQARHRDRSPRPQKHTDHDHSHRHARTKPGRAPTKLPFNAAPLSKHDLGAHRALFASYLDIQKQLVLEDLPSSEVKGRWKSFVSKWYPLPAHTRHSQLTIRRNTGTLAEGWYDPVTLSKAQATAPLPSSPGASSSDDTSYGPSAPPASHTTHGPSAASFADLSARDEQRAEAAAAHGLTARAARKAERAEHSERLAELAPRADPGTRERRLEKRADARAGDRALAEGREGGVEEQGEAFGGEDGVEGLRAQRKEEDRRRSEREVKRDEILAARRLERDERVRGMREREDKAVEALRAIARERFGPGAGGG